MLPMPKLLTMLIVVSPPRLKLDSGDRLKEYFTPFTRLVRRAGEGGVPGGKAVPSAAGGGALMPCSILQICKFIRQQLRHGKLFMFSAAIGIGPAWPLMISFLYRCRGGYVSESFVALPK